MFGEVQQDGGVDLVHHPLSPGISRRAFQQARPPGVKKRGMAWSVWCASERHRNEADKYFTSYWL